MSRLNIYSIFLKTANKNQFSSSHRQNLVPFRCGELAPGHVPCPQVMLLDSGYGEAAWRCVSQQGSGGGLSLAEGKQRLCDCSALILLQFGPQTSEGPQQKHGGWNWCAAPLSQQSSELLLRGAMGVRTANDVDSFLLSLFQTSRTMWRFLLPPRKTERRRKNSSS